MLWACDFNFVRGEDSLVRAIWAGKPFVWQIYPQDDNAHYAKLEAFLDTYLDGAGKEIATHIRMAHRSWNDVGRPLPDAICQLLDRYREWARVSQRKCQTLGKLPSLSVALAFFAGNGH